MRPKLTPAEIRVVRRIALGWTTLEIAALFGCSHWTVKSHVKNARMKLEASNHAHLVAICLIEDLI